MFHRVNYEDWTSIIPIISFWILFVVFLVATLRSVLMKKTDAERMAALPLDDPQPGHRRRDPSSKN